MAKGKAKTLSKEKKSKEKSERLPDPPTKNQIQRSAEKLSTSVYGVESKRVKLNEDEDLEIIDTTTAAKTKPKRQGNAM